MTVLEKIKRCVSLVWDFQEIYGEEDIEDFCRNELRTYPQHNEIMEYFKHIAELEQKLEQTEKELTDYQFNYPTIKELQKENAELDMKRKAERKIFQGIVEKKNDQLTKAKELLERLLITSCNSDVLNLLPNCSEVLRVRVEAEQFLRETDIDNAIQQANKGLDFDKIADEMEQDLKDSEVEK